MPETHCMKRISVHMAMAFRVQKRFGTFKKQAPGVIL